MRNEWILVVTVIFYSMSTTQSFIMRQNLMLTTKERKSPRKRWDRAALHESSKKEDKVEIGSKEYLEGFVSSPIEDSVVQERGSGLEQSLKLAGGVTIVLAAMVVGFMASNGLL